MGIVLILLSLTIDVLKLIVEPTFSGHFQLLTQNLHGALAASGQLQMQLY